MGGIGIIPSTNWVKSNAKQSKLKSATIDGQSKEWSTWDHVEIIVACGSNMKNQFWTRELLVLHISEMKQLEVTAGDLIENWTFADFFASFTAHKYFVVLHADKLHLYLDEIELKDHRSQLVDKKSTIKASKLDVIWYSKKNLERKQRRNINVWKLRKSGSMPLENSVKRKQQKQLHAHPLWMLSVLFVFMFDIENIFSCSLSK